MTEYIMVFVAVGSKEEAKKIASALVENRLAACVQIIPSINSVYKWKGKICDEEELLLLIKSRLDLFDKIKAKVKELHSYEVAEIMAIPVIAGSEDFLSWIKDETGG